TPFTGHTGAVTAVTVTDLDGHPAVVSGSNDRSVRVWDLATGAPIGTPFTGHTSWVRAVTVTDLDGRPIIVSAGGHRLIIASWPGSREADCDLVIELSSPINALAMTGQVIACATDLGIVLIEL
ncbi:MAG: hypothetical protein QG597_3491, partial [Actinomycetota bacterium]|nr:hypothetical protein [Actinomycetota bacterium]